MSFFWGNHSKYILQLQIACYMCLLAAYDWFGRMHYFCFIKQIVRTKIVFLQSV